MRGIRRSRVFCRVFYGGRRGRVRSLERYQRERERERERIPANELPKGAESERRSKAGLGVTPGRAPGPVTRLAAPPYAPTDPQCPSQAADPPAGLKINTPKTTAWREARTEFLAGGDEIKKGFLLQTQYSGRISLREPKWSPSRPATPVARPRMAFFNNASLRSWR